MTTTTAPTVDGLAAQVEDLQRQLRELRHSLATEVRTHRLVVVDNEGRETVVAKTGGIEVIGAGPLEARIDLSVVRPGVASVSLHSSSTFAEEQAGRDRYVELHVDHATGEETGAGPYEGDASINIDERAL